MVGSKIESLLLQCTKFNGNCWDHQPKYINDECDLLMKYDGLVMVLLPCHVKIIGRIIHSSAASILVAKYYSC